jgi:hypothetical protein
MELNNTLLGGDKTVTYKLEYKGRPRNLQLAVLLFFRPIGSLGFGGSKSSPQKATGENLEA